MMILFALLLLVIVALMVAIRLAPMPIGNVHLTRPTPELGDYPSTDGFTAVRAITSSPEEALQGVMTQALNTPRTVLFAGSLEDGLLTFETRSKVFGFPDYSTVWIDSEAAPKLVIWGRLRFGRSDLGVNRGRILEWLRALGPLTVPL